MPSNGLLVVIPVLPERAEYLRQTLNRIGNDIRGKHRAANQAAPHIDFPSSRTLHFARLALFADPDRGPNRQRLLLVTDYQGSWEAHIAELFSLATDPDAIWGCCEGYTGRQAFPAFIRAHMVEPQAYYIALPNFTLDQIRSLLQLRLKFDTQLIGPPAATLLNGLWQRSLDVGRLALAIPDVLNMFWRHGPLNTLLAARRVNATIDRVWYIWLFNRLTLNSPPPPRTHYSGAPIDTSGAYPASPADETVPFTAWTGTPAEDLVSQNQLTLVTAIQPEQVQRLQAVLAVIDLYARRLTPPGSLVGISTIHTVRWALIDDGKRLLFASNYDGTWQNYIDEFAELILSGLDAIWESSYGFPESGAQDVEALKDFLRGHQAPANAFYSSYPDATLLNIVDALQIKQSEAPDQAPTQEAPRAPVHMVQAV